MLFPSPPLFRNRRGRSVTPRVAPPTPPPAPLTLVAATYDESSLILTLTFDRPVNFAEGGFSGAAIRVGDPTFNHTAYNGTNGAFPMGPGVVGVSLSEVGEYFGTEVDLVADGTSGIVAVDDGGTWPGTGGTLFLPYP